MRNVIAALLASLGAAVCGVSSASAQIVVQPGPTELQDIWTTSVYSFTGAGGGPGGGRADQYLQVGGWGDLYYSLLQFNLTGLPVVATSVALVLYDYSSASGTPTPLYVNQITSGWDWTTMGTGSDHNRLWWADRPSTLPYSGPLPPATPGQNYSIDITNLYNEWQSGATANFGVELTPEYNDNQFDIFMSSRASDPTQRPALVIYAAGATSAPEPSSLAILGTGLVGMLAAAARGRFRDRAGRA
jgi:hypothetical protein